MPAPRSGSASSCRDESLDEDRRPVPRTVIEIWQANAAGRYIHSRDNWDAPLDPNFTGAGRVVTDDEGRYRYITVRPGAYPWGNHRNAWRPAHIHLSLLGPAFATRLVTQMYFPDDPLIEIDPIANAVPMPYRQRMVGRFDIAVCEPNWALGYRFDIVLKGTQATPFEDRVTHDRPRNTQPRAAASTIRRPSSSGKRRRKPSAHSFTMACHGRAARTSSASLTWVHAPICSPKLTMCSICPRRAACRRAK